MKALDALLRAMPRLTVYFCILGTRDYKTSHRPPKSRSLPVGMPESILQAKGRLAMPQSTPRADAQKVKTHAPGPDFPILPLRFILT